MTSIDGDGWIGVWIIGEIDTAVTIEWQTETVEGIDSWRERQWNIFSFKNRIEVCWNRHLTNLCIDVQSNNREIFAERSIVENNLIFSAGNAATA